ncbi:AAA family ATPase [Pseudomonas thivervalensis]|uniref:ATP-dependent nuclease n=1 Tax=Pseudomonas thivervalensis TaxID=86265 RepID=UPI003D6A8880
MIVGLFIRNYKIYQNINYIPLSKGKLFSAIVGENGAGKSSILEALNSYFNNSEWNCNHIIVTSGFDTREPFICPVFLFEKSRLPSAFKYQNELDVASSFVWAASSQSFNSANRKIASQFCEHRDQLVEEGYSNDTHYLFPVGLLKRGASTPTECYFSIFETHEDELGIRFLDFISGAEAEALLQLVQDAYSYVYLPSEIDFQSYTKIEGKTIQALLGRKLDSIVRAFISSKTIIDINRDLTAFLNDIAAVLEGYEYKKPSKKQTLFNHSHFTEKVIEAFFDSKVLTRIDGNNSTPVNNLSSGEKRKALIDVARGFLLRAEQTGPQQVILAIDEPELSLHVSACFEQFEKLKEISEANVQTIITTHWYGFMPIISNGVAVYISKIEQARPAPLIDLRCFRDDIKKLKEKSRGILPANIELKGMNDLVQSIIASITGADYKWIVCEGSSDKIYLEHYFSGDTRRPFILPVGAAKNVKKIFAYIVMALDSERDDIEGRVLFLLDTDKSFEKFESSDGIANLRIRRLLNSSLEKKTLLVHTTNTVFFPPTEIEDSLDAESFLDTLAFFEEDEEYQEIFGEFSEELAVADKSLPSGLALNLRSSDKLVLEKLFDSDGFKIKFALAYTENSDPSRCPEWITEIKKFLYPPKPRLKRSRSEKAG